MNSCCTKKGNKRFPIEGTIQLFSNLSDLKDELMNSCCTKEGNKRFPIEGTIQLFER